MKNYKKKLLSIANKYYHLDERVIIFATRRVAYMFNRSLLFWNFAPKSALIDYNHHSEQGYAKRKLPVRL